MLGDAGQEVQFTLRAVNTGTLRLENVRLQAPAVFTDNNMTCTVGAAAFVNGSSQLLPQTELLCSVAFTVKTVDIESEERLVAVAVTATSVLNASVSDGAAAALTPTRAPGLTVLVTSSVTAAQNMPGKCRCLLKSSLLV
jgi:hypothetical protein